MHIVAGPPPFSGMEGVVHMTEEIQKKEPLFGVIAEVAGRDKQLVLLNLTFGRLILTKSSSPTTRTKHSLMACLLRETKLVASRSFHLPRSFSLEWRNSNAVSRDRTIRLRKYMGINTKRVSSTCLELMQKT
jgi:hypothetical protein